MWGIISSIGSAINGVASGILGPVLNWFGVENTNKTNAQNTQATNLANIQIANHTNALNESLQREQWARDDTAYQRQVADMQAAGLNPLSSFNSPSSSPVSVPMQGATLDSPEAVAPQLNLANGLFNNLVDTVLKQEDLNQRNKEINLHSILNGVDPNELDKVSSDSDTLKLFKDLFDARRSEARKNADSPYVRGEGQIARVTKDIGTTLNYLGNTVNHYVSSNSSKPTVGDLFRIKSSSVSPSDAKILEDSYKHSSYGKRSNNLTKRLQIAIRRAKVGAK